MICSPWINLKKIKKLTLFVSWSLYPVPCTGQGRTRTFEGFRQQIYSLPPLTAWVPTPSWHMANSLWLIAKKYLMTILRETSFATPSLTEPGKGFEPPDLRFIPHNLKPAARFGLATCCLQNSYSTTELRRQHHYCAGLFTELSRQKF